MHTKKRTMCQIVRRCHVLELGRLRWLIAYVCVPLAVIRWTDALLGNSHRNRSFRNSIEFIQKPIYAKTTPINFQSKCHFVQCMQILLIELPCCKHNYTIPHINNWVIAFCNNKNNISSHSRCCKTVRTQLKRASGSDAQTHCYM